eukprot:gene13042-3502_t
MKRAYHLLLAGEHPGAFGVARQMQREKLTSTIVSASTVIRGARKYGKEIGKPIRCLRGKPAKRLTHDTKAKRLAFSHENKRTNWSRVMFTDRKKFNFSYPGAKVKPVDPDLNPIENLWGLVASKVDAMGCKSFEDFKQAIRGELSSVRKEVLKKLVDSMPKGWGQSLSWRVTRPNIEIQPKWLTSAMALAQGHAK